MPKTKHYRNRLATRQMAAFASLMVALAAILSWLAYGLARDTLVESIRERGRTLLTAFEADAADRFATADAAWFGKYLEELTWRDPTVAYGAVVDDRNVVIAHSEKDLVGKAWQLPPGKPKGTMKILERVIPWKKGSALEFTIVIEAGGRRMGALQLGIDYTKEAASLRALARKISGVGLLLLVLSLLVAYRTSTPISASLGKLTESARKIAGGDLSVEVPESSGDIEEFRELGGAFNAMTASLRGILARIGKSSSRLSAFGGEVSHIIREQAESTSQQASSVSEVTATMEELSRTSHQIARNAEEVMLTAANSVEVARAGTVLVRDGVAATGQLKRRILDISSKASLLNDKSDEIGKVVALIKEIAGEIHLLALNAAIESAAAGEHGRRFAVVASEVRRLAEKTRESTETIRASVGEIQAAARDTASVTQDGIGEMESWEHTVAAISSAFEEIIRRIETTSEVSAQISMATHQQTSANEQVVRSMHHVAETAQSSAKGMKELAASADELSGLVAGLCREAEGVGGVSAGRPGPPTGP